MLNVRIEWRKILGFSRYILSLVLLLGIGYLGYFAYFFVTNIPKEVRVTNVTGTSVTITWYTDNPDVGVVAVKSKNSFTPLFQKFDSVLAYDDRDVAVARKEMADSLTKQAQKTLDVNEEVLIDEEKLNDVRVEKKGRFYTHHVTISNLSEQTKYYFRIGNGLFFWNVKEANQKTLDFEAPAVKEFSFETFKSPEEIKVPDSAYGKILSLAKNKDGFLVSNPSTDSIVFLKATKEDGKASLYLSSVTNSDGGWIIDKSGLREENGEIGNSYVKGEDKVYVYTQFENLEPLEQKELIWGETDAPAQDIIGNEENQAKILGNIFDILELNTKKKVEDVALKIENIVTKTVLAGEYDMQTCKYMKDGKEITTYTTVEQCAKLMSEGTQSSSNLIDCIYTENGYKYSKRVTKEECDKLQTKTSTTTPTTSSCQKQNCPDTINGVYSPSEWSDKLCACIKSSDAAKGSYNNCSGSYAKSCEESGTAGNTTNCFCKVTDASGKTIDYLPLRGVSCRPTGCANNRNEDFTGEGGGIRSKCKYGSDTCDDRDRVLCGKNDYSNPGCAVKGKCPTGTTYNANNKSCEETSDIETPAYQKDDLPVDESEVLPTDIILCSYTKYVGRGGKSLVKEELSYSVCQQRRGKITSYNPVVAPPKAENCSIDGAFYDCGYTHSKSNTVYCGEPKALIGSSEVGNCGGNLTCVKEYGKTYGICTPYGQNVGIEYGINKNNVTKNNLSNTDINYDCWANVSEGKVLGYYVTKQGIFRKKPEVGGNWIRVHYGYCEDELTGTYINKENTNRVYAESFINTTTKGSMIYFPESGLYDVQIGRYSFKNIKVNKDNNYFFFVERNGKDGYQQPNDPKKPLETEDLILNAKGAIVSIATQSKNFKLTLSKGINLVSFNFLPSLLNNKALSAIEFLQYANSSGRKVSRITSFEGGKWNGGVGYTSSTSTQTTGNDLDLLPGSAYAIIASKDSSIEVPGFAIKNSIPVALSSGWNLIGINGYKKTYTANSLIDSINGIAGLTSDNVTWWPTSKGRYESFQKSEGIVYGFDFPILKNQGYFVRIKDFSPKSVSTKSLIWNPESDLHGQPGSK